MHNRPGRRHPWVTRDISVDPSHYSFRVDAQKVVNIFAGKHTRRVQFSYSLRDTEGYLGGRKVLVAKCLFVCGQQWINIVTSGMVWYTRV